VARRIEVDIIGDASSLQRAFRETATGAQRFEAKITGSFHNIARSAVLAAGAFVGIRGAADAFTTVIKAAVDAQVSQKALATQMKASGESFTANQAAIEKSGLSLARYGFTIEDSQRALAVLERATGSVTRAMQIQGIAANVAAATGRPLAQISLILGKAYDGQTASLKRLGVQIPKHVSGMQAMYIVAKKYAGQGLANTTVEKQFQVALHNSEVIIGTALLPTVNRYLGKLTDWLDKMNRSGRLQRDVNQALQTATGIINALKGPVEGLVSGFKALSSAVGGTKNAVELLGAAFAAWKITGWISALGALSGSVKTVGTSAKTSTGQVTGLRAALGRLGAMGVIGVTIAVSYEVAKGGEWLSKWLGKQGIPGVGDKNVPAGSLPAFARAAVAQGTSQAKFVEAAGLGGISASAAATAYQAAVKAATYTVTQPTGTQRAAAFNVPGTVGGRAQVAAPQLTPAQRLQIALAADPTNIGLLRQQAAMDRQRIAFLQHIHAQGRGPMGSQYVQELTAFYNDLNSTINQIASIRTKAANALKKHLHLPGVVSGTGTVPGLAAFGRTETRGFAAGLNAYLGAYGPITGWQAPMSLQIAQARAGAFGTTADQNTVLRRIRAAAMRALHSGRLVGQGWIDVYNAIASINQQLAQQTNQYVIKFRRTAQGLVPNRTPAYATGGVVIHGGLHLHGVQDMTSLENQLEARAKRRPQPRRGR
jgi:hypothetical protein